MKFSILFFVIAFSQFICLAQSVLIPFGSSWKYLDNGIDPGTLWRDSLFNDSRWKSGLSELGYGDNPVTVLNYGQDANNKYITYYFRKQVSVTNLTSFSGATLNIRRDDGAMVYLNGVEIYRSNLPDGTINATTLAINALDDGAIIQTSSLPISAFVEGTNTIAVEIHQTLGSSSDVTFDLNLEVIAKPANQLPTSNADIDKSITLPSSSVRLYGSGSDIDGTIISYAWTWVSGPSSGTISSPNTALTSITGLGIAGTYVYRLTVTDNNGATASDTVAIEVTPTSQTLIPWGSSWKYLDNGSNQGTGWRSSSFDDSLWKSGLSELGYGDSPVTILNYGPDPSNKYITYYFRKQVNFINPSAYSGVTLNIRRDDGAVVYVNGVEIYRSNLPTGVITNTTLASEAADDGANVQSATLPVSAFNNGTNTIAVEIHQALGSSSDVTFDLKLFTKSSNPVLTRGPYLQMANGNSVSLRWRTDVASNSKIEVGTVFGTYTLLAINSTSSTEHEVRIMGLSPDTKYYYRFGSSTSVLQAAVSNYFTTAPPANTTRKIRVAAFGDCGTGSSVQSSTLSSYQNYIANNPGELMLLLGDNAYNSGTDTEYQSGFFNVYSSTIIKNHILFPAPGNHDYANTTARQIDKNVAYYKIFTTPQAGECGGVASGTESYYSYDWGNIHFLSLDSYGMETASNLRLYDTLSPQVTWIKKDLEANIKKWTIAYWHHPPFTMGSHNSDTENELVKMRQMFIRIMERYGVDMIICGHSHDYERSYLLKGYYLNEAGFNVSVHAVNSSSGKYDGSINSCAYQTSSDKTDHGTVYVVSGSSGNVGAVQANYPHNAMPFSLADGGMFYFEVEDNRLDAKFIKKDGLVGDQFTIMKDVAKTTNVSINAGQSTTLLASWKGAYNWSTGATTRSINVSPVTNTSYTCTDRAGCITDRFNITITSPLSAMRFSSSTESIETKELAVFPVPVRRGEVLHIEGSTEKISEVTIMSAAGQIVTQLKWRGTVDVNTAEMVNGLYFIINKSDLKSDIKKFIILD
jgi:hypothetical protein